MSKVFVKMAILLLAFWLNLPEKTHGQNQVKKAEMAGYLLVPNERVPKTFNAGFSMYVTAWPLLDRYPGRRFQTGLFGTWMFAQYETKPKVKVYSDIEGGLGWWRDTRFATETPKFIMGGVARNFSAWANGPGAGKGRDWKKPQGKYAVAQLSPSILWPPDGLNLKQGTSGELFGYGYLPLPLFDSKTETAGTKVPTGNQCWTLFINSKNFKGPIAFFTPFFWSRVALQDESVAGMFLDSMPSNPNRALQMETQYVPAAEAQDSNGNIFARVAPTHFPVDENGNSVVVHQVSSYNRDALWNRVEKWFQGGDPVPGVIPIDSAYLHKFPGRGGATWRIYQQSTPKEKKVRLNWSAFAKPFAPDPNSFGYRWDEDLVSRSESANRDLVMLPEYYRLDQNSERPIWKAIPAEDVPAETGLAKVKFEKFERPPTDPYVTPENEDSFWKRPGPAAGPFYAYPGDGSKLTYYWYRFADQPAMLNADLSQEQREKVQLRVEMIHRNWNRNQQFLPPPKLGELADIDPALIVSPPNGLEVGFVPIVTRQENNPNK